MKYIILLFFSFSIGLRAQNLIPNGSFEDTLPRVGSNYSAKDWVSPNQGSPDYFSYLNVIKEYKTPQNFAGYQETNSGNSYMGIVMYSLYRNINTMRSREYIQVKLNRTLVFDSTYCLQLFVSLADSSRFASRNQLGIYFSSDMISSNDRFDLPNIPQIIVSPEKYISEKEEWLKYNFQYRASGGENYITIGNFNDTSGVDTIHVMGGGELFYQSTYYYIDDVYLGSCDSLPFDTNVGLAENTLASKIRQFPNPIQEQFYLEIERPEKLAFQLYNIQGQETLFKLEKEGSRYLFSLGEIPRGLYFLRIVGESKETTTLKLVKE